MAPEGIETSDGRMFLPNSLFTRQPPIPIMFNDRNSGHENAELVGNVIRVERDGAWVIGYGVLFSEAERATKLVTNGELNRVSVDTIVLPEHMQVIESDNGAVRLHFSRAEIAGVTIVPISAFADARIEIIDELEEEKREYAMLTASLAFDVEPTVFTKPEPKFPTPFTVTDDGRVYGHLAVWDTCHIGVQDKCVVPPRSQTGNAHFQFSRIGNVRVGRIVMDMEHIGGGYSIKNASRAYSDTGTIVAYVHIEDGKIGPWMSGVLEPGLSDSQKRRLSASGVSGDWRKDPITGNLELVAILAVPTPGFTVPLREEDLLVASALPTMFTTTLESVEVGEVVEHQEQNMSDGDCIGCEESEKARAEMDELLEATAEDTETTDKLEVPTDEEPETQDAVEDDPEPEPEVEEPIELAEPEELDELETDEDDDLDQLIEELAEDLTNRLLDRLLETQS